MCGIAGLIGKRYPPRTETMEVMLDCIRYRGPDDSGIWQENGVLLGHRRLSILDLSSAGRQPMLYQDRYVLVFNGEIYNYPELRDELKKKGYIFYSESDSEIIPAAYDCWGEECQLRMNGMWAFAIYDRQEQKLFCSRDRYGIKPFYYFNNEDFFSFGSEIKQLLPVLPDGPLANRTALELYLAAGYLDYSEETLFRDIYQLRGGCCLRYSVSDGTIQINRWFEPVKETGDDEPESELIRRFGILFHEAVEKHLRADVEIGSCLSGGMDSSAIVCEVNRILRNRQTHEGQHVITSCFNDPDFDERKYSHAVLKAYPELQSSEVFPDMDQLMAIMRKIVWHMDEPFASSSIYAQWEVFHCAQRLGLKVMLDGQGADELLAGYHDYYKVWFCHLFRSLQWRKLIREIKEAGSGTLRFSRSAQLRFFLVTAFDSLIPDCVQKYAIRIYHGCSPEHSWLEMSGEGLKRFCEIKQRFSKKNAKSYTRASMEIGLSQLLHYEDRNSMACSVEARVPFLDAELAGFAEALPIEMKIRNGRTKWIMRNALNHSVPESILSRRDKMGFVTPESRWFSENHAKLRSEVLQAAKVLSPLISEKKLLSWYDRNETVSPGDYRLWRILCAAEWIRVFDVRLKETD